MRKTALNRDALLALKVECPTETVDVKEFGAPVIVKGMDAKELTRFQKSLEKPGKKAGEVEIDNETFAHKLLVRCLVDGKGERLLKDDEFALLQKWPGSVFHKLSQVAMRLNGYSSAEGNSDATTDGGSSSA
jgi:hypothetical protein